MTGPSQKFFTLILFILATCLVKAETGTFDDVHVLARIQSIREGGSIEGHAIQLENAELKDTLKKLRPDDEVLLKGYISYSPVKHDTKMAMNPVFHIQSIQPVSLKAIGISEDKITEPPQTITMSQPKTPGAITISPEVASAMTMTASVLMLQDLTSPQSPTLTNDIQKVTFLSAGVLATGYFIWKQLKASKK